MPELRFRFNPIDRPTTRVQTRSEPDDLYDPPAAPEGVDPYLVDANEYDSEAFDIYGLNDYDEDDE